LTDRSGLDLTKEEISLVWKAFGLAESVRFSSIIQKFGMHSKNELEHKKDKQGKTLLSNFQCLKGLKNIYGF
jgi:hypothetical protein